MRIGGRDTNQHMVQERISLRNDHTRFLNWHGTHNAKVGALLSYADYAGPEGTERQSRSSSTSGGISWDFPARAMYGVGDPDLSSSNWQTGLFVQDDWAVDFAADA